MKTAYFDCFSGISGDMVVGALIDAGADFSELKNQLSALPLHGYSLAAEKTLKNGISGTRFTVTLSGDHGHRGLADIIRLIEESGLNRSVKKTARAIFTSLARAEAKIHNAEIDAIHFHEVGAVDSIVDIVASAVCLDLLGIEAVYASPIHVGEGFVKTEHGMLPVPAPATVELLANVPVYSRGIAGELATPTGAAIIAHHARSFGPLPAMKIISAGYGAGTKDLPIPNLLRVYIGETESAGRGDWVISLETNIDDMNPEFYQHVTERLLECGALDVYTTPVIMKKSRPGVMLTVLARDALRDALSEIIFSETTTAGIRVHGMERLVLDREVIRVATRYGDIPVKILKKEGAVITVAPEYEACRAAAKELGVPLRKIYDEAKKIADSPRKRDQQ